MVLFENEHLQLPKIRHSEIVAKSKLFKIEELHLTFSNGAERVYERLVAGPRGAVMVVAINDKQEALMIREYSAGTHRYELAFPKGLIEPNESREQAANRELKEEVGYGAKKLTFMKEMTLAPGYLNHRMQVILAEDLYEESLEGDEPEPLELVPIKLEHIDDIIEREEFSEARSIAALFLVRKILQERQAQ